MEFIPLCWIVLYTLSVVILTAILQRLCRKSNSSSGDRDYPERNAARDTEITNIDIPPADHHDHGPSQSHERIEIEASFGEPMMLPSEEGEGTVADERFQCYCRRHSGTKHKSEYSGLT